MTTIYYLLAFMFISVELDWLFSPIEKTKGSIKFFKLSKLNKGKKWDEYSLEYKSELKSKIWMIFILFWFFIGLFTVQWVGFLFIILFNFLVIAPLSNLTNFNFMYTVIHWINSLIGFLFGVFIVINHYHLKINLTSILLSYF